jgi:glycosyltransferase involved in cell wall biosynthesis
VKVLHIETGMHLYGGALQVSFLLRGLRAYPGEHILVCPLGSAIGKTAREFARVIELPSRGVHDLAFLWRLNRLLRRERRDLQNLHSRRGADMLGGIAAKLAGVPAILSRRVDNPEPRWLVALKYRLYARVITISEGIRQVLLQEGLPPQKVVCVRSAVDTDKYQPGCTDRAWFHEQFGLSPQEQVVGMIAQFIERKGHKVLLDAIPAILAARPHTRVLLFGQGPLQPEIGRAIVERGLTERVHIAGFRSDLEKIVPCLDLVVHPAAKEGLGVALLQAAACGVPIIACRTGGIPEIVRHERNGLLIPVGDSTALSQAVVQMLTQDDLAADFGRAGVQLVHKYFSVAAMVAGNHQIYQNTLDMHVVAQKAERGDAASQHVRKTD